ncbi:hypothetical protein NEMIN01_1319 [Nematocida minor]|uniref:uncharacterized protein n=1 Tax=Nematocida minor TaxID=1912983 RepID=UPI002220ABD5|nr:uncharacterized protein NEMIN01_1319 [Nematocida minor]KAI5190986.1 hypothetical protein NEMIN01_1319 [Nematocida minor]
MENKDQINNKDMNNDNSFILATAEELNQTLCPQQEQSEVRAVDHINVVDEAPCKISAVCSVKQTNFVVEVEKMTNTLIQMKNYDLVTKDGETLLKRVSFSLPKGKMIALLGLSGDGKTTLMDSMAGLCKPSHTTYGEVHVENEFGVLAKRDVADWFTRVNYSQQKTLDYGQMPLYTVLCSIAKCEGKKNREVRELMETFRISKVKNVEFKNLSGGEQKRAMLIAGLLSNKEFNIWDEPLTGLDSEMAKTVIKILKNTQATNLLTVHQVSEDLLQRFNHIILMHRSTIIYSGPASAIKEHFTSKGIVFPSTVFFVDYLMKMCANNSDDEFDTENIKIFNGLAESILQTPSGPKAGGSISHASYSLKLSFVRILEILKRVFFFDKMFKGSSFVMDLYTPTVMTTLILFIFTFQFSKKVFAEEGIHKYLLWPLQDMQYKLVGIRDGMIAAGYMGHAAETSKILEVVGNISWINMLSMFFMLSSICVAMFAIAMPSNFLNPDFYRLCKSNIREKQITTLEFISSLMIDIFLKKTLIIWVAQSIIYGFIYFQLDKSLRETITISHPVAIGLIFVSSLVAGLHGCALNLAPISQSVFGLVSILYLGVISYLPNVIHSVAYTYDDSSSMMQLISIFRYDSQNVIHRIITNLGIVDAFNSPIPRAICTGIFSVVKFLFVMGPIDCFMNLISKIALYQNKLQFAPGTVLDSDAVEAIADSFSAMEIVRDENSICINTRDQFLRLLFDISGGLQAHEVFDQNKPLGTISGLSLLWSTARFFILPCVLLCITGVYTYRTLHPKLRN